MVWLRRLVWMVLGLILLVVAVAAYLVITFDAERYKSTLIDWVAREHQRTLALDGPVSLGVWPRLHVKLTKVGLSEYQRQDSFASADELELSVQTLPLMKGQLRVDRVNADGVTLQYRRDEAGKSNIDDLLKPPSTEPKDDKPGEPLRFEVAGIQLRRLTAQVDDLKTGVKATVGVAEFRSGRLADGVKTQISLQAMADVQRPRAAKAQFNGTLALTPDIAKGSVLIEDLVMDLGGQTAGVDSAQGRVSLARLAYDPAGQSFALSKLELQAQGQSGPQAFTGELAWKELLVQAEQLKGSALQGKFGVTGPTALSGSFSTQAPQGSFKSITLPGLVVDFKVTGAGLPGQDGLAGQVKGQVSAYSPVASEARVASVDWALEGQLNANPFTTKGVARLTSPVPRVEASAAFTSLDLNRFMPAAAAKASAHAAAGSAPAASAPVAGAAGDAPIDLIALQSLNGRFDVSAKQLAWRQFRVADAQIQASLDGGRLDLQNLSGAAWGGRFQAKGSAQAGPQQPMALQASAQGVNILALLKDVANKEVLEGTGEVRLDLQTAGHRVSQLTSSLNGSANVVLRDGSVRGINLAKSLREARARLTGQSDEVQKSRQTEETDFTEMSASFQIANGVARNDDLSAKSPFLRVGGQGTVDLPRRRVDYTVRATVTNTGQGQGGADLEALQGVTIPVALSGPWDALDWRISWSEVALGSVQNTLKKELEKKLGGASGKDAEQKVKDQLKDKLKGLFK